MAVLLTNADLDHSLGLLLMRQQAAPLIVYATEETRSALAWIDRLLQPFGGMEWRAVAPDFQSLGHGIACRAIVLGNGIAFQLRDDTAGALALIAPAVGKVSGELRDAVNSSGAVFFDGTFWSDDELRHVRPAARSAREMNHLPISEGSLELLCGSAAPRKIYTHINNTNPIFMPGSSERERVEQAGIEIACDGLEVVL